MKKRIKIDSALLSFIILMTGVLFIFRDLYPRSPLVDDVFDFFGFIALLNGILLRMSARGHKKAHSHKGAKLVTSGPYAIVRNPMYLGSFLMGAGFILMVWPWWSLPVFALLFYTRFNRQMVKEENLMMKLAGSAYKDYCGRVPRVFPSFKRIADSRVEDIINLKEAFSTKDKFGLLGWPVLAILLESFQEQLVFETTLLGQTIKIFLVAAFVFAVGFWILGQKPRRL